MKANKNDLHESGRPMTQEEFINRIKTDDKFAKKWGELGPLYGKQWRRWKGFHEGQHDILKVIEGVEKHKDYLEGIDQIFNLIYNLKTNPDSRRLMVNAWNVGELDQMVLPPCHYGFQVYTRELSLEERYEWYAKKYNEDINSVRQYFSVVELNKPFTTLDGNVIDFPKRAISLMWNQRSVDTFLGLPFNIASYGLLLEIIAKAVNMVPDQLIGNLGDCHLYSNHIEQAKEQIGRDYTLEERLKFLLEKKPDFNPETDFSIGKDLKSYCHYVIDDHGVPRRTREPYPLPTLKINSGNENWHLLGIDDIVQSLDTDITFKVENYQSHPTIKAPLSN